MMPHGTGQGQRGTAGRGWRCGAVGAGAVFALSGAAEALAQQEPSRPSRPREINEMQDDREERRQRALIEAQERRARNAEIARNGASVNAQQENGAGGGAATEGGRVGALVGEDGMISINFAGPIELSAFLEYVSRSLGLTMRTVTIPSSTVTFYAPVQIPVEQLLPLTQSILEDQNLSLVFDEQTNTYVVKQAQSIPVTSQTTRVFPTPLLSPSALQAAITQQIGSGPGINSARFTPLDDLGVLMVTASTRTLNTIEKLLGELTALNSALGLHSFEITQVSATYARDRILTLAGEGVLGGQGQRGGVPRPQNPQQASVGGSVGSFSNIQSRLFIGNGNTLILRGSADEARMLGDLVEIVDEVRALRVKRYIVGTAAAQVAQSGQELGLGPVV